VLRALELTNTALVGGQSAVHTDLVHKAPVRSTASTNGNKEEGNDGIHALGLCVTASIAAQESSAPHSGRATANYSRTCDMRRISRTCATRSTVITQRCSWTSGVCGGVAADLKVKSSATVIPGAAHLHR
jgi:hypothetical protein